MSVEDLRKRLERLNRGTVGQDATSASELGSAKAGRSGRGGEWSLGALIPGLVRETNGACLYSIERVVAGCWEPGRAIHERFRTYRRDAGARSRAEQLHDELVAALDAPDEALLFVDLETCGFSGTPVFLIGVMYLAADDFCIEQLLARDYSEEIGILTRFSALVAGHPHLITFNGKTFDWPFLADRATLHGVDLPAPAAHCDLLHIARRRFRSSLPDCRLQTLERYVCGRLRSGDIPGSEIPAAYHAFVRGGDARQLRDIVHHNFLDLVTMADILAELLR